MTLEKEGPLTPGALALRERVRPPSMTRVIATLTELGLVVRSGDPMDGRQILVSLSPAKRDLIQAEQRASQEWLQRRLAQLGSDERATLFWATALISALIDEGA